MRILKLLDWSKFFHLSRTFGYGTATRIATASCKLDFTFQTKLMDLSRAHDTSRIVESMLQLGTEAQRWVIFAELKDRLRYLAMSQYGKHVVLKLVNYGAKEHRLELFKVSSTGTMERYWWCYSLLAGGRLFKAPFCDVAWQLGRFQISERSEFFSYPYRFADSATHFHV